MTETLSKREQLREERRRQILEAALSVFAKKGYHATNVSDVAAQAGVSQGTIYWYFDSKDELFQAATLFAFEDFGEAALGGLEQYPTATEKLRSLALAMEEFADVAEGLFMLFLGYWAASDRKEEGTQVWMDLLREFKDIVAGIIEEGVRSGEFKPVDAEALVWALLAAYDGLAAYDMFMPEMDLKRVNKAFVETLLNGLLVAARESE
jgi:AcrR family transcriptional regulator